MNPAIAAKVHSQLQHRFPEVLWAGRSDSPEIALTFDDGPSREETLPLLDILAKHDVKATFFQIGKRVEATPQLTYQVAAAGHQLGIHGYSHRAFPLMLAKELHNELQRTLEALATATGQEPKTFCHVRPPYGAFLPSTLRALHDWHYRPVMWSLVPFHWLQRLEVTVQQVLTGVTNGTLLVLHEGLKGPSAPLLAASILPLLKVAGYRFITVEEMWQSVFAERVAMHN